MGEYKGLSSPTTDLVVNIIKRYAELEKENQWLREDLERRREDEEKMREYEEKCSVYEKRLAECAIKFYDFEKRIEALDDWGNRRESEAIKYKALFLEANAAKRHYRRTAWDELNNNFSDAMKQDTCKHEAYVNVSTIGEKRKKRCQKCGVIFSE